MNTQNSLIDEGDLPVVSPKKENAGTTKAQVVGALLDAMEGNTNGKKPRRKKAKPYHQLNAVGRRMVEKKAEKQAVKTTGKPQHQTAIAKASSKKEDKNLLTSGKKLVAKASKKEAKPKASKEEKPVKSIEKEGKLIASGSGVATGSEHCAVCGKKLSRGTSIADGMGPECARQVGRLPAGVTMSEHYETLKVYEEPGKEYIKLQEAGKIAKSKGVSGYKFQIAYGGNRMLRPPLNENFRVIVWKNCRYIKKVAVTDKELKPLLA